MRRAAIITGRNLLTHNLIDRAEKSDMEDVYVARQPIFDKDKNIYAYELLFRDGTANYVPDIDGDVATTTLLSNTFFTIGMQTLAGGRKTFINFTQNLLEKQVPLLLPKESTVIEILEDVKPGPVLIEACQHMASRGYIIALDDFVYGRELEPLIALANIIKFDFRSTYRELIDAYLKICVCWPKRWRPTTNSKQPKKWVSNCFRVTFSVSRRSSRGVKSKGLRSI